MKLDRDQDDFYDEEFDEDVSDDDESETVEDVPLGRNTAEIRPLNFRRDEQYRGSLRDRGNWEEPDLDDDPIEEELEEEEEEET